MHTAIAYSASPVASRPRRVTVDRSADAMTITFPLPPRWLAWAGVVTTLAVAAVEAAGLAWVAMMVRDMARHMNVGRTAVVALAWPMFLVLGLSVALCTAAGVHQLWRHLRLGHVPRTLTIAPDRLTLRWPGFRAVRRREWSTGRVRSVRWRPVRDVFGRTAVVRVSIRFDAGRPTRFTLSGRQPEVVDRVRQGLSDLLPVRPA